MTLSILFIIFIGFAGGIAVGSGLVAFLTVLGIVPRLVQITTTYTFIRLYEIAIISGAVFAGWTSLRDINFHVSALLLIPIGLGCGVFIGMLAAALTEVLNVLPILAKRVGFGEQIIMLVMAIVLGKIIGSLFHWLLFVKT
jgi:stage V sporulation protein AB